MKEEFSIDTAAERDLPELLAIMEEAAADSVHPEWFISDDEAYMRSLDGIGAEDVFSDGKKMQSEHASSEAVRNLKKAQAKGLFVVLIEYPTQPKLQKHVTSKAARQGLNLLLTHRDLTTIGLFKPAGN